jgi:hypothetical protein
VKHALLEEGTCWAARGGERPHGDGLTVSVNLSAFCTKIAERRGDELTVRRHDDRGTRLFTGSSEDRPFRVRLAAQPQMTSARCDAHVAAGAAAHGHRQIGALFALLVRRAGVTAQEPTRRCAGAPLSALD